MHPHVPEIWREMPGQKSVPSFENGKCVFEVPVDIEDFINQFSVTYGKGSFILKGSFQGRSNYYLRTSVGTDMGYCASINPVVSVEPNQDLGIFSLVLFQIDFNPLGGPNTEILRGANSTSGESNGLQLVIDTEAYDHGYAAAAGSSSTILRAMMLPIQWYRVFLAALAGR